MKDFLVTVEDLHKLRNRKGGGFCVRNSRIWARSHNLDFKDFVKNGVLASKLIETGDQLAEELVDIARERTGHGQG